MPILQTFLKKLTDFKNWFVKASLPVKTLTILIFLGVIWYIGTTFIFGKKKVSYQTAKVTRGTIVSSLSESGQILSANFASIQSQASGQVSNVFIKDGDTVKSGDIIAEIRLDQLGAQKNSQAWSNYLSAKANLDNANATSYSLQSDMFNKWNIFYVLATNSTYQNADGTPNDINRALPQFHIAQDDWLAGEAKFKNQVTVVSQAQAALSNAWLTYQLTSAKITAPMDGTISNITIVPGIDINNAASSGSINTTTTASQRIAVIQNGANPLASFNVSEVDIGQIKIDQNATLTLDSIPGKTFTGKVASVDRIGVVSSGVTNYPAIIQFDTNVPEILPNMAVTASILIGSKDNVLLVPSSAVQTSAGQSTVRVLKSGQIQQVSVETGLTSDTQTEITSGLSEGNTVVTSIIQGTTGAGSSPFSSFGAGRGGAGAFRLGGGGR